MTESNWVKVASFSARYLAEVWLQALEAEGIPFRTRGEESGIWGPGFAGPTGRGFEILVLEQDREAAEALLDLDPDDDGAVRS
jgi:hypothetical protein